jgi:hypothetical protein
MPFPYFGNISTDFTGVRTRPRKRKTLLPGQLPLETRPSKRRSSAASCPRFITIVRATRQLAVEKAKCLIFLEDYFDTPNCRDKVIPNKMGCSHIFCRDCIETHLSSSTKCPVPWCDAHLPMRPDVWGLCAAWTREYAAAG